MNIFSYNEVGISYFGLYLHEFLIFLLLRDRLPSILKKIGIASFLSAFVSLICLILKLINYYHFEGGLIAIDWTVSVLYKSMQGLIAQSVATSAIAFICSQSPYSMRGSYSIYGHFCSPAWLSFLVLVHKCFIGEIHL